MSSMVFGREYDEASPHLFQEALDELRRKVKDPQKRAMALNLMHDHRVSEARESKLKEYAQRTLNEAMFKRKNPALKLNGEILQLACEIYYDKEVCFKENPHYIEADNQALILNDGRGKYNSQLKLGTELVRVLDLTKLWRRYAVAKRDSPVLSAVRERLQKSKPNKIDFLLDELLDRKDKDDQQKVVEEILRWIEGERRTQKIFYQSNWVTTWKEFKKQKLDEAPAERWSEVLGLDHGGESGHWLILLVYPVTEEMVIVRPTQLDARWYARHYPAPIPDPAANSKQRRTWDHPMDLNLELELKARGLLREYLHKQIPLDTKFFLDGGRKIGQTSRVIGKDLDRERLLHRGLLVEKYGSGISP